MWRSWSMGGRQGLRRSLTRRWRRWGEFCFCSWLRVQIQYLVTDILKHFSLQVLDILVPPILMIR